MKLLTDQAELWNQFAECERNEMIITKSGRCLFPLLKFHLQLEPGEDETALVNYSLGIERVDPFKWKFRAGHWYPLPGKEDFRVHWYEPDDQSPAPLRSLLRPESINFAKVKLSNRRDFASAATGGRDNYFYLSSFCHYRPVVRIESSSSGSWQFPVDECAFIAVTHYQNDSITHLKKHNNPHAKGFLSPDPSLLIQQPAAARPRAKPGRKRKLPLDATFDDSWHTEDVIQASLVLETMSRTPRYETIEQPMMTIEQPIMTTEQPMMTNEQPIMIYPSTPAKNTFIPSNNKYLTFNHRRQ